VSQPISTSFARPGSDPPVVALLAVAAPAGGDGVDGVAQAAPATTTTTVTALRRHRAAVRAPIRAERSGPDGRRASTTIASVLSGTACCRWRTVMVTG
jgi:hypothetical protein